jgi:hypothetical protein
MSTLQQRIVGALQLNVGTFEEVEADQQATGQALLVVVVAGLASAVGAAGTLGPGLVGMMLIGEIIAWLIWAVLTFVVGTKLFPEKATHADLGQMLRVLGFAAAPGLIGILGIIPVLGTLVRFVVWVWRLLATIIGVRQALDYTSTPRAVLVCVIGWAVYMAVLLFFTMVFGGIAFLGSRV